MTREELRIQSFLKFGYFIDYDKDLYPIDFSRIDKDLYAGASRTELVEIGAEKLQATFSELYEPGATQVVPISGGLDSRLILGALRECTEASNIHTYTYGDTDTYDFDIGCFVADHVGTRHVAIPIRKLTYHLDELLDTAKRTRYQTVLFHHPPLWMLDRYFGGGNFWSGYVGDAIAGSHLPSSPSVSLREAQLAHLKGRVLVTSQRLSTCSDAEYLPYMGGGTLAPDKLTLEEQVLFGEAAAKFTAPHVLFEGFRWLTPLINSPWMDFMLSVPYEYRVGENLMIDVGHHLYPELFGLPCTNRLGHTLRSSSSAVRSTFWVNRIRKALHQFVPAITWPNSQYNDFNEAIRTSPTLRAIVWQCTSDLARRKVCDWIDFKGLWSQHDSRLRNHGIALVTLASLEVIFKAREAAGLVKSPAPEVS